MTKYHRRQSRWLLLLAIVLFPIVIVAVVLWVACALVLLTVVWSSWCPRRKYAIVVYSNSPVWKEYFDTKVIPLLDERAAVLNWSERERWHLTLPVMLFRLFAGGREFNPMAIVFKPLAWPRRFRFYKAFRSFKRNKPDEVEALRAEFFSLLDELAAPRAA